MLEKHFPSLLAGKKHFNKTKPRSCASSRNSSVRSADLQQSDIRPSEARDICDDSAEHPLLRRRLHFVDSLLGTYRTHKLRPPAKDTLCVPTNDEGESTQVSQRFPPFG